LCRSGQRLIPFGGARVGSVGSVLSPVLILACEVYRDATMSVDVQMRTGWFVFAVVILPLLVLGPAMGIQALLGVVRLRRLGEQGGQAKARVTLLLLVIGTCLNVYVVGAYVASYLAFTKALNSG
jgi:hypothetical protein